MGRAQLAHFVSAARYTLSRTARARQGLCSMRCFCAVMLFAGLTAAGCTESRDHPCLREANDVVKRSPGTTAIVGTSVTEIASITAHLDKIATSPSHRKTLPLLENDPARFSYYDVSILIETSFRETRRSRTTSICRLSTDARGGAQPSVQHIMQRVEPCRWRYWC